jgi:hypothetical protein
MVVLSTPPHAVRRRRAQDPLRKPGWQVHTSVADAVRHAVEVGLAESQNALVEHAVLRYLAEHRRKRLYQAYAEAAQDGEFMSDLREVSDAHQQTIPATPASPKGWATEA